MRNYCYLVQFGRWTNKPIEEVKSVDDIIYLKLMGAAEFEYDPLGELKNPLAYSLLRIARRKDTYDFFRMNKWNTANGEALYIYCNSERADEYKDYVRKLIKDGFLPKFYCNIGKVLRMDKETLDKYYAKDNYWNVWWDIEHDFFIFLGEENKKYVELMIEKTIERHPDKFPKPKQPKKNFFEKIKLLFGSKQPENA